jgi:hypothetical protein
MTDHQRVEGAPAPGYGEYAPPGWVSPVEVSADPAPDSPEALAPGSAEPSSAGSSAADPTLLATGARQADGWRADDAPPPTGPPVPGPPPAVYRYRPFNRFATILLLGYGVYSVIVTATSVGSYTGSFLKRLGDLGYPVSHFTSIGQLQTVGDVSAIASVAIFLVVGVWSIRRLRAGKNSWVPLLVTGLAVQMASGLTAGVVFISDPGISRLLTGF